MQKQLNNGWNVKSELYYKQLDDLVTGDDELRYANNGKGETIGLDTLIRKEVTDKLSGWLSVSLSESTRTNKRTGENFDFEYDQPINASLVANYQLTSSLSVGAKLWVHSGALYTPIIGATPDDEIEGFYNPVYGPINSKRFPLYNRLDLRLNNDKTLPNGRQVTWYLELLNICLLYTSPSPRDS